MKWHQLQCSTFPVLGLLAIIALWQVYTSLSGISRIVLPSPADIVRASISHYDLLLTETWPTVIETLLGFGLALVIGIPLAFCVANWRVLNLGVYPILVATQSVPKVAIAPIILVWFGFGIESKLALAFLVAFFPVVVDTATSLRATPFGLLELARSLRASRLQVFLKVQMPAALPFDHRPMTAKVIATLAPAGTI